MSGKMFARKSLCSASSGVQHSRRRARIRLRRLWRCGETQPTRSLCAGCITKGPLPAPPQVVLAQYEGQGRGLAAACQLRRGRRVELVPSHLVITAASVLAESSLRFLPALARLPVWSLLALHLIELRHWAGLSPVPSSSPSSPRNGSPTGLRGGDSSQARAKGSSRRGARNSSRASSSSSSSTGQYERNSAGLANAGGGPGSAAGEEGGGKLTGRAAAQAAVVGAVGQRDCHAAAQAAAARLQPYLAALPCQPSTVLQWSETQVVSLLAGSPLQREAQSLRAAASASWLEVQPLVELGEREGLLPSGLVTQAAMQWALSILLSRAVRLPGAGGLEALVPWADMLNHDPAATAFLDWQPGPGPAPSSTIQPRGGVQSGVQRGQGADSSAPPAPLLPLASGFVVLEVDRDYAAGQQIFISYGAKSCGQLLLQYGFSPADPSGHPDETYPLEVGLQDSDPLKAAKALALVQAGLPASASFPLRIDSFPEGLLHWAAFCAPSPEPSLAASQTIPLTNSSPTRSTDATARKQTSISSRGRAGPKAQTQGTQRSAVFSVTGISAASTQLPHTSTSPPSSTPPSIHKLPIPQPQLQPCSDAQLAAAQQLLQQLGLPVVTQAVQDGPPSLRSQTAPPSSPTSLLNRLVDPEAWPTAADELAGPAQGRLMGPALEMAGWRLVANLCGAALKGYDAPASAPGSASGDELARQCAVILAREKQILARAQYMASSRARELRKST
ncbi:hypothetical protein V8C86DRAFT_2520069 [Haematococcus lacustris]